MEANRPRMNKSPFKYQRLRPSLAPRRTTCKQRGRRHRRRPPDPPPLAANRRAPPRAPVRIKWRSRRTSNGSQSLGDGLRSLAGDRDVFVGVSLARHAQPSIATLPKHPRPAERLLPIESISTEIEPCRLEEQPGLRTYPGIMDGPTVRLGSVHTCAARPALVSAAGFQMPSESPTH
jgi:hypothetical protein